MGRDTCLTRIKLVLSQEITDKTYNSKHHIIRIHVTRHNPAQERR